MLIKNNMAKKSDKKRVIVTGGAGFIGAHLTRALCQKGFEVFVVDNLVSWFAGKGPLTPTPETPFAVSRFPHS